jgi:hypothetical protein
MLRACRSCAIRALFNDPANNSLRCADADLGQANGSPPGSVGNEGDQALRRSPTESQLIILDAASVLDRVLHIAARDHKPWLV